MDFDVDNASTRLRMSSRFVGSRTLLQGNVVEVSSSFEAGASCDTTCCMKSTAFDIFTGDDSTIELITDFAGDDMSTNELHKDFLFSSVSGPLLPEDDSALITDFAGEDPTNELHNEVFTFFWSDDDEDNDDDVDDDEISFFSFCVSSNVVLDVFAVSIDNDDDDVEEEEEEVSLSGFDCVG